MPDCVPLHICKCAAKLSWNRIAPAPLSNSGSNHAQRLRPLLLNPTTETRIERLGRGNAHTEFERLLYLRSLPVRAAVRLLPDLSIKALDPVGTRFLLLYYC